MQQPHPHVPPVVSNTAAPAGVTHSGLAQAELPQKRLRCDLDLEVMWYLLAELMDWKTQGLLTPEQFENAKVALGL